MYQNEPYDIKLLDFLNDYLSKKIQVKLDSCLMSVLQNI